MLGKVTPSGHALEPYLAMAVSYTTVVKKVCKGCQGYS